MQMTRSLGTYPGRDEKEREASVGEIQSVLGIQHVQRCLGNLVSGHRRELVFVGPGDGANRSGTVTAVSTSSHQAQGRVREPTC